MREVIDKTNRSVTTINRDEHDESGRYVFQTQIYNDDILARNKRKRLEGVITKGRKNKVIPGGARFAFNMTSEEWAIFKRDYPDIIEGLKSRDDSIRMQAGQRMQLLKPEWSVMAGNW